MDFLDGKNYFILLRYTIHLEFFYKKICINIKL